MPPDTVKIILHLVVLLSGGAIAIRELRPQKERTGSDMPKDGLLLVLGAVTAVLCSLSGAGGPVLVMPLLVAMGVPARTAVGIALLDSVAIALPAIAVYGGRCHPLELLPLLAISLLSHAAGVTIGSTTAGHIPQTLLKRGVALFAICFSLYMLLT